MKKFLLLVLSLFCALPVFAQEDFNYSARIILRQDASAEMRETITFYTDSEIELPVLKRSIRTNTALKKVSVLGNIKYLDFVTDRVSNTTFIQSVMNPHSRIGKNYITLFYVIPDAVYSALDKDCFKFDLQLSGWSYKFKEGTVLFKVDGNHIIKNTSVKIDKTVLPIEEGKAFALTPLLNKNISVDFSFEKGFFDSYSVMLHYLRKFLNIAPIFVTLFMLIYSYVLWAKYGKDPTGPFVAQYKPPQKITAVFAKYLLNRNKPFDFSYFVLTLISLSLKGYIKISEYRGEICVESLKGTVSTGLYEEDKLIYERLFAYSPKILLDIVNATYISDAINALYYKMRRKKKEFFDHNSWYAVIPCTFLLMSFLLVFPLEGTWQIVAVLCFTITLIAFIFFLKLIKNVSPDFLELYNHIMGFKDYMTIAESGRTAASNPFDKESIFCDNIDYAYAFGIGPYILKLFAKKFDPCIVMSINCIYRAKIINILSDLIQLPGV